MDNYKINKSLTISKFNPNEKNFSLLRDTYDKDNVHISLNEILNILNTPRTETTTKDCQKSILKGLFKSGNHSISTDLIKGANCLFYDIDVKPHVNAELYNNPELSKQVYSLLQQISIITWRSWSGNGIAGLVFVDGLKDFDKGDEIDRISHIEAAKQVYSEIHKILFDICGANVEFDEAQAKLRQIRYLTPQKTKVEINHNAKIFSINANEIKERISSKQHEHTQRIKHEKEAAKNIIISDIENIQVDSTIQQTFDLCINRIKTATSVHTALLKYSYILAEYEYLIGSDILINAIENAANFAYIKQGRTPANTTHKTILDCFAGQKNRVNKKEVAARVSNRFKLKIDKELCYTKYISECENEICDFVDKNPKSLICAQTGSGKTTTFLSIAKKAIGKTIFLVPLNIIRSEIATKYANDNDIFILESGANENEIQCALNYKIVVTTYEKGKNIIGSFDYIFIDEAHNLINSIGYRNGTINSIALKCKGKRMIIFTGTPNNIFREIGFKTLKLTNSNEKTINVHSLIHKHNNEFRAFVSHVEKYPNKKIIVKINSNKVLIECKEYLLKNGIPENEIAIFNSSEATKSSDEFKQITTNQRLLTKYTLTTSFFK